MSVNSFDSRDSLTVGGVDYEVYRLDQVSTAVPLPYSLKVLLENLLRNEDGRVVTAEQVDVVAAVEQHARQAGQPFEYAAGLPEGWTPTSYRYVRSKDQLMMWSATWTTPDGQYVAVQQVADATDSWVSTMTNNGKQVGKVTTEDGRAWLKRDREGKVQRSLVHRQPGEGELTTLVTGTGTFEQLETFANHLEAVEITQP